MTDFGEIVLLLCGNFNPITNMHLRMFEIAKDHLANVGYSVFKGLISPYERHNGGDHPNFVSVEHRISMIKYALDSSNWIQLSSWHCEKFDLPTIATMLQHHQSRLDLVFKNHAADESSGKFDSKSNCRFIVKLLCGADVLLRMKDPDNINELHCILKNHGVVVITRAGFDIENIIDENDLFWMYRKNIVIVKDYIENQISSRKIRKAVARGQSIKYLVNDAVEQYIYLHNLYTAPNYDYKDSDSNQIDLSCYEMSDSYHDSSWQCNNNYGSSTETLTNLQRKSSRISYKNRHRKESHFTNTDKSKLIGIPVTEDGVIQIIADKETNL